MLGGVKTNINTVIKICSRETMKGEIGENWIKKVKGRANKEIQYRSKCKLLGLHLHPLFRVFYTMTTHSGAGKLATLLSGTD